MSDLTIAAGIARGLLKFAGSRGADPAGLAAHAGIDLAAQGDPDGRTSFAAYVELMREAKRVTGDPALALHYAEHVDFSEISVVGLLAHASETMGDALIQMNRYGRLAVEVDGIGTGDRFVVQRDCNGVWLIDGRKNPNAFPELTETTFGRMSWGTRQFRDEPFALEVQVTHADPGYRAEYERIFRAPVSFGCARNAVRIDETWHRHRLQRLPRYAFGVFSEHADNLLKSLESSRSVRGQVESLLLPILHTGQAGMNDLASKMGVSRQTLFRRLKAEGATFETILDDLRQTMARDYLSGRKVSVNETAYLVGFSDAAAFSRAFKRWTGVSPRELRNTPKPILTEESKFEAVER